MTAKVQIIERNGVPEYAVIPCEEYEEMVRLSEQMRDIRAYDAAMADAGETVPHAVMQRLVISVRERLPDLRPVAFAKAEIDSGFISAISFSSARFSSLRTSASDSIEVNQILGSPGLGLYSPRAMADIRARIFSCGMIPITMAFTAS